MKVLVTGLPRSGTSFLTGLIAKMGYSLGNAASIKRADKHNKYGYFEHVRLMKLSESILEKLGGDYFMNIPPYIKGWTDAMHMEKKLIEKQVSKEGIELYKDNKLILLSDIYGEIYPDAKWVYIKRDISGTYKSRFGQDLSLAQWEDITANRLATWEQSKASATALQLEYEQFFDDFDETVNSLAEYLSVTDMNIDLMKEFFRPSQN